jgi:hypothetical protein
MRRAGAGDSIVCLRRSAVMVAGDIIEPTRRVAELSTAVLFGTLNAVDLEGHLL